MELVLSQAQQELLREVLNGASRDLHYEIADTDLSTYKATLRERAILLESILDLVGGPLADHDAAQP